MRDRIIHELKEKENVVWSYPSTFTPGALRLIEVEPLSLKSDSKLVLHEFPELNLEQASNATPSVIPKYAAMSHVWKPSPAIASRGNTRALHITIKEGTHEISWLGLMQAAIAASHLKCDFIWLDYVCIHQTLKEDKKLQIKNMANIYAYCSTTIVMLGGMKCAQRLEDESFWDTRAWTLQESVESVRRGIDAMRYALIEWPYDTSLHVSRAGFQRLEHSLAIVPIRELGIDLSLYTHERSGTNDGKYITVPVKSLWKNGKDSLIRLLWRLSERHLAFDRPSETDSSIWRSLWFRTSTMEHDILYSSMNLFSSPITLDVNYDEDFDKVLIEFLAMLHKRPTVPYWFKIGHRIPVCSWSGLFPQRPHFKSHDIPSYNNVDAYLLLCGDGCCDIDLCVEIMGASKETGHTICTKILKLIRIAPTPSTLPVYTNRYWQHVRKILVSYTSGDEPLEPETWSFEIDTGTEVEEVNDLSGFYFKTTVQSEYDRHTIPYTPVVPKYNEKEKWDRSNTTGADLEPLKRSSSNSRSVDLTALCWFDGRLGPYLAIIGFNETYYQNPVVYFFDRTKDGNIQRVGTGKLLLAEKDRIKSDIPWSHLRVGGKGKPERSIEKCACGNKKEVPLIKKGEDRWWEKHSDSESD